MKIKNYLLLFGGILSFGVAIFQLAISIVPEWSAYFGAGEALTSNRLVLLAAGFGMTIVFVVCGLYGLSGAGVIRRLPLLRLGLFVIGAVYIFRGLPFIFQILAQLNLMPAGPQMDLPGLLVTRGSFLIGLSYWVGLATGWKDMEARVKPVATGI